MFLAVLAWSALTHLRYQLTSFVVVLWVLQQLTTHSTKAIVTYLIKTNSLTQPLPSQHFVDV